MLSAGGWGGLWLWVGGLRFVVGAGFAVMWGFSRCVLGIGRVLSMSREREVRK